jgi:hypothetical protein
MPFRTRSISDNPALGTAAVQVDVPEGVVEASGNFPGPDYTRKPTRVDSHAKFRNTHATQILYVAEDATATATAYNYLIDGGDEEIVPIPHDLGYFSIIADGSSTPVTVEFGKYSP